MTILLFSPFSNIGHFSTYNIIYTKTLLELGHTVVMLTSLNDTASKTLFQEFSDEINKKLFIFEYQNFDKSMTPCRLFSMNIEGALVNLQLPHVSGMSKFYTYMKKLFFYKKDQIKQNLNFYFPFMVAQTLKDTLKIKINHVLFMYLDMITIPARKSERSDQHVLDWSGILFGPKLVKGPQNEIEPYLTHPSCKSIFVLDAAFKKPYTRETIRMPPFYLVPDIINPTIANYQFDLKEKIIQKAKGRKIIFLGGAIAEKKYMREFLETAKLARTGNDLFFIVVGQIFTYTFSEDDQNIIKNALEKPGCNLFIYDEFVKSEEEFNAIIKACDLVYVVHKDFPFSSNLLIKAAHFNKPVIGLDEGVIGRAIKDFSLGRTINSVTAENILENINAALDQKVDVKRVDAFLNRHKLSSLKMSLMQWSKLHVSNELKSFEEGL